MSERSLKDLVKPIAKLFCDYIKQQTQLMEEMSGFLKTLPDEEFTKEKIDDFLELLTQEMLTSIPEGSWAEGIKQVLPDVVRQNFYAGFQASRTLREGR